LWLDAVIFAVGGVYGIARVGIPTAAFDYLATLASKDPHDAFSGRDDLMALAWRLFREHPLLGVGIGGYSFYSPDPTNNGFPHNLFLEIAAELGFVALIAFAALVLWAFWEAVRQLRDHKFPLWSESTAVLALLIFGFLQMIKSGDMNDNRSMWLFMGLPFLLRHLANKAPVQTQATSPLPSLVQSGQGRD
jgi:O-antigen ligase